MKNARGHQKSLHGFLAWARYGRRKLIRTLKNIIAEMVAIPWYLKSRSRIAREVDSAQWPMAINPMLMDRKQSAAKLGEYFWQDLFVARQIIELDPRQHIDVGSRIDGFIAHLACVRQVTVLDVRHLPWTIDNVSFVQRDLTKPTPDCADNEGRTADCVSCLHTLEHVGLGRYGDQLGANAWKVALTAIVSLAEPGGTIWISVPVGKQRIEFNAHRVFNPETLVDEARSNDLNLTSFHFIDSAAEGVQTSHNLAEDMKRLAANDYALGIFRFTRPKSETNK